MMDRTCLTKVFNKYGVIKEVLIPMKRSKNGSRFAFVKYEDPISSEMAIFRANGMFMGNQRLLTKKARFEVEKEVQRHGE